MEIRSPLPGRVVQICVSRGDAVEAGQLLLVLEAMKMEYQLRSPLCGAVTRITAEPEQRITPEDVLLTVE